MNIKLHLSTLIKTALLLTAVATTTACVSDAFAENEIRQVSIFGDDGNKIRIINGYDKELAVYRVNGKTFTWQDLSPSQQNALLEAEKPLKRAEKQLQAQEKEIQFASNKIEAKAEEIEKIAHKIEDMFEGIDYEDMTLKQIRKHQEKVSKIMDEHEMAMKVKELELQELEDAMVHIDQDLVEEVETSAKQYERVLVDVAAKL